MSRRVLRLMAAAALSIPALVAAPPQPFSVQSITFDRTLVDPSTADQTVTATIVVAYAQPTHPIIPGLSWIMLVSADGLRAIPKTPLLWPQMSCDAQLRCTFLAPILIASGTAPGTYYPELMLTAGAGSNLYSTNAMLQAAGITSSVTVGAAPASPCTLPGLLPEPPGGGISDTTPPALVGICLSTYTLDTRSGAATLAIDVNVTDDLSGLDGGCVGFLSPTGNQSFSACFGESDRTAGSASSGTYRTFLTLAPTAASGAWIYGVSLRDRVGNYNGLYPPPDVPATLTVISNPDTTPPAWAGATLGGTYDVSAGDAAVPLNIHITDDLSGFDPSDSFLLFVSPSGKQSSGVGFTSLTLTGTANDGWWAGTFRLPRYSEPGVWRINDVRLKDQAANRIYMSPWDSVPAPAGGFTVISSPSDTTPPQITSFSFAPGFINTSLSDQTVTATLAFSDAPAGLSTYLDYVNSCQLVFISPSGQQQHGTYDFHLAGSPTNGVITGALLMPRYSELGTWRPYQFYCYDSASNGLYWYTADFVSHNFPTNLIVIQPSLQIDGTFDSSHHTIIDTASNTTLTDPTGQVPSGTTAAIDVLDSPPAVEAPTGYSIGTGFINITLNPPLAAPLPPPGLTMTLTLRNQMTPGSTMALYKIDPTSGKLVPVPKAGGGFVTGTVNGPLGQTATFTGVSTFSTVVGLTPPAKPGDLNNDNIVNCADIRIIRDSWNKRPGQFGWDERADYNRDGVVNIFDFAAVSRYLPRGTKCN